MRPTYALRRVILLAIGFLSAGVAAGGQGVATPSSITYPDSADGLQAQIASAIIAARMHDSVGVRAEVESLGIPNADQWFAANFDPRLVPQLRQDYATALSGYQSHIFWVMDFAKFPDFGLRVQPSELPPPLADSGLESLLPRPVTPVKIQNYRFSPTKAGHGPPSWVSSFVYIDGRFRFVGGTYPFWAERLTVLRGLMAMRPAVIGGMTVQAIAYEKDIAGPNIAAVVRVQADVTRKGRVSHIKVLSGDEPFITDAKEYLKEGSFDAIPKIAGLNGKRQWEIAVIFCKPKN